MTEFPPPRDALLVGRVESHPILHGPPPATQSPAYQYALRLPSCRGDAPFQHVRQLAGVRTGAACVFTRQSFSGEKGAPQRAATTSLAVGDEPGEIVSILRA